MNPAFTPSHHPKDFIETREGLIFAVVASGLEQNKVLCFLRYHKTGSGWQKLSTEQANSLLARHHPGYLHYSPRLDAKLHAVPLEKIHKHHKPKQRLLNILALTGRDAIEEDLVHLIGLFQQQNLDLTRLGITGSLLVGLQNPASDIDLLCYDPDAFHQCRAAIQKLLAMDSLQPLNHEDWRQSYQRRSCALSFDDYLWHEQRKYNKAMVKGRKFDLSLVEHPGRHEKHLGNHQKHEAVTLRCRVTDDRNAFAYPAEFAVDHQRIGSVVSFTATYTGQARRGELIEVSGTVESSPLGLRIVVGSSREAPGEYIKVIRDGDS